MFTLVPGSANVGVVGTASLCYESCLCSEVWRAGPGCRSLGDEPAAFFKKKSLAACELLVPQPRIEPTPLQWQCRALTTGPLGKALTLWL